MLGTSLWKEKCGRFLEFKNYDNQVVFFKIPMIINNKENRNRLSRGGYENLSMEEAPCVTWKESSL